MAERPDFQTVLNVSVGARRRRAGIPSGAWRLVIVLLVPGFVGKVPMTVLAAWRSRWAWE